MDEKYGWFYKMLQDVRENISGDAEIIAAAATVLAAFFIVAKISPISGASFSAAGSRSLPE